MGWLKRSLGGLGVVAGIVAVGLASWEPYLAQQPGPPPPPRDYRAEVLRDEWGVPHIQGKTDADVAFGTAWAHAEDDFATLQDVVAMTRGRYGAIAGPEGAGVDFAYHFVDARGAADRGYDRLPADVRAVLEGYAAGLNRYAETHRSEVKLARLFPVSGKDIATGFALRLPFFFGLDRVLRPLSEGTAFRPEHGPRLDGQPAPLFGAGGGDQLVLNRPMPLPMGENAENAGSNAFAVAPARAGDGVTRLLSNSHQPWRGGVAWYELRISSDQGWTFAGATFPGSPFPFMGHNANLGWTNTVNRPDLIDIYRLELDPSGTNYRLDGQWQPLERKRVWLPVRFGPFVLPVPRTVWRSKHGPAMINARGAFAVRYAGMDRIDSVTQYYRLTRAQDFAQWQAAMALQAVPATNFVYADRAGNIAYWYNAALPARTAGPDWRGVLPGDRSDLIWPGPIAWDQVPHLINPASGYLFNSNNTPFLAAGPGSELDPARVPAIWGVETDLTNRTLRAAKLLAATPRIGRAELLRIKYDTGYDRAGYVAWMLDGIARLDLRAEPDLAAAQRLLAGWDMTADGRGNGADALAVMVLGPPMKASYGLKSPPDPKTVLAETVAHLKTHFGRIDPPLGDVLRIRQGPGPHAVDLPMDGGGDTLRAATDWDADPADGRLSIKHGDSFIMLIEWDKAGQVRSESIQPYGAATTRPGSPHFTDQAALFAAKQMKPVYFTRDQIAAHARSRKVVTNR
ncbi:MAG: acylase [Sphingomonadaceae bacterium]|nr:acylase [Sphingomonadaceae bacterium]